ncbi:MAG: hypothetical protein KF869_15175 [Phycisphaeraceae bacterium]|nr:hypothetical protein [Phycisphaeraceae bacterium]
MNWVKANWVIILLSLIALAALPTAMYFSGNMREKIRADLAKRIDTDMKELNNVRVQYHLQAVDGTKLLEKSIEPNAAYTQWYRDQAEAIRSRTGAVSEAALEFNRADHGVLVRDLFPQPEPRAAQTKPLEFAAAYIRAHPAMLAAIRAGEPMDPAQVSAMLTDYQQSQYERIRNQTGKDPTEEEKAVVANELRALRVQQYQRHAGQFAVYAGPYVFEGVPASVPTQEPSLATCWDWQERFWIHKDICRAIDFANRDATGGVPDSVVKRIVKIGVRPAPYLVADGRGVTTAAFEAGTDKAPLDFSRSITGRVSGPGSNNKWFDVRVVRVELVLSSRRVPAFMDALAATNFMTVLDMDLFRVDPVEELRSGYYYGESDPVIRAVFDVETVWLREWRKDLMPNDVKGGLGMLEGVGADDPFAAPPPPPARRPPAGAGGGEDDSRPRGRRRPNEDG